jgi:RNA polymerase sigma-70 factor (ECF subfamily)
LREDAEAHEAASGAPCVPGDASTGVKEAVAALPERQRLVVFLRYYGDLDYRGIADVLGLREGTVAATLHQAQRALRRVVEVAS